MTKNEIISFLKNFLKEYASYVSEAYIFGSMSRDDYTKFSDIDIAINCRDIKIYNDICYRLDRTMPTIRKLDIHNIHYHKFHFNMEEVYAGIKII